ncbi:MAG: hypothetical protein KME52_14670 [Desmonostoc geniculatum HA4340-LM1]|nr:hypothetical protein [Desmonostoc geniculatum HA4340-LM1]
MDSLLDHQFERLSPLEKEVMYLTCINREAVGSGDLQSDILPGVSKADLLESLESLTWRSLIEKTKDAVTRSVTFTQQPVVMEYMTNRLVKTICQEIKTGKVNLLNRYPLIKFTAQDYIKQSQIMFLIKPILANLTVNFKLSTEIEQKIKNHLEKLGDNFSGTPGYCGVNLVNLLQQLEADLTNYHFSSLKLWQSNLENINLNQGKFSNTNVNKSVINEVLAKSVCVDFNPDETTSNSDVNDDIDLEYFAFSS